MANDWGGFQVNCQRCQLQNQSHSVRVHIDWDGKFFIVACKNCRACEVFRETGRGIERIQLFDEPKYAVEENKPDAEQTVRVQTNYEVSVAKEGN